MQSGRLAGDYKLVIRNGSCDRSKNSIKLYLKNKENILILACGQGRAESHLWEVITRILFLSFFTSCMAGIFKVSWNLIIPGEGLSPDSFASSIRTGLLFFVIRKSTSCRLYP